MSNDFKVGDSVRHRQSPKDQKPVLVTTAAETDPGNMVIMDLENKVSGIVHTVDYVFHMISPCDGGCWYCNRTYTPMDFCSEFDTNIHRECVVERFKAANGKPDPELRIIAREFKLIPPLVLPE